MKMQAQTRMHNGMVMVLGSTQRLTEKLKDSFDRMFDHWWDEYRRKVGQKLDDASRILLVEKAKRRCQVSWNHEHFGSEQDARRFIAVVSSDFKQRYPKNAGRLVAHWRPVAHTVKREAGNAVTLSFYLEEHPLPVFEIRISKFEMYQQALHSRPSALNSQLFGLSPEPSRGCAGRGK